MLLCLLLAALPEGPYVRWIDVKGDIHVDEVRAVLEESPAEVRVRMPDGSERAVPMARVLDLVRENPEHPEERQLLDARRDVASGLRAEAARKTLDRLAGDGPEPWIREYAAATRALLAEQEGEEGAAARIAQFLEGNPRSRFVPDCVLAQARIQAQAHRNAVPKMFEVFGVAHAKIVELDGPIVLRCRLLRDVLSELCRNDVMDPDPVVSTITGRLMEETGMGRDYGAAVLVEAETKWAKLFLQRLAAAKEESKGRPPRGALHEVQKLKDGARLDLPEVRSDIERELGRLLLACGEKEGAGGAYERARDLAPDPRRREAAEEALKALRDAG